MDSKQGYIEDLKEIRHMMDRSTRLVTLSGMTGIVAGSAAIVSVLILSWMTGIKIYDNQYLDILTLENGFLKPEWSLPLLTLFISLFLFCVIMTIFLTRRRIHQSGEKLTPAGTKYLMWHMWIPMVAGGIFCLLLLKNGFVALLAPSSLLFYGITLFSGSKFTLQEVKILGLTQMFLGLLCAMFLQWGLLFWTVGFGLVHIVYGVFMYNKYER